MNGLTFRDLRADEVDVRIGTVAKDNKGVSLLLYKDARCDMNILDETVGPLNWQRQHEVVNGNLYCSVGIRPAPDGEQRFDWVWKQDVGTESKTEAQKGEASDSFKRACFNWGIGRELYTAPFIWVKLDPTDEDQDPKKAKFWVKEMVVENKRITTLTVCWCNRWGDQTDEVAFQFPRKAQAKKPAPKKADPVPEEVIEKATPEQVAIIASVYKGDNLKKFLDTNNITSLDQTPKAKAEEIIKALEERAKAKKGA